MNNFEKIKKLSKRMNILFSVLIILTPLYYISYWIWFNDLPSSLISNMTSASSIQIPISIRAIGFLASLLPLSALLYLFLKLKKLFSLYIAGALFTIAQVKIFKQLSKGLFVWIFLSIIYETIKSFLISLGNIPGERTIGITFTSQDFSLIIVASIFFILSWVMETGKEITDEQALTI